MQSPNFNQKIIGRVIFLFSPTKGIITVSDRDWNRLKILINFSNDNKKEITFNIPTNISLKINDILQITGVINEKNEIDGYKYFGLIPYNKECIIEMFLNGSNIKIIENYVINIQKDIDISWKTIMPYLIRISKRRMNDDNEKLINLAWYNFSQSLRRKLKLLHLTDEEIDKIDISYDNIYTCIKDNPWKIPGINYDKLKFMCHHLDVIYDQTHIIGNQMINEINKWMITNYKFSIPLTELPGYQTHDTWQYIPGLFDLKIEDNHLWFNSDYLKYNDIIIKLQNLTCNKINSLTYKFKQLNEQQQEIINHFFQYKLSVVDGKPGTGKTKVISIIYNILKDMNIPFRIMAFTGKAVQRIKDYIEVDDYRVCTIDSFILKPEMINYCIIDELSMVGINLMNELLEIIGRYDINLALIGDHNQLPPIERGDIMSEILKRFSYISLTQTYRNQGVILEILNDMFEKDMKKGLRSRIFQYNDINLVNVYRHFQQKYPNSSTIVMSPYVKETVKINSLVSQLLNNTPYDDELSIGDKVIYKKNDRKNGLMNGTEGILTDKDSVNFYFQYKDKEIQIPLKNRKMIERYYCSTIYKSQGSEWDYGIIIWNSMSNFLSWRQLYTAISRIRYDIIILGTYDAVNKTLNSR